MELLDRINERINDVVFGFPTILLIFAVSLIFTFGCGFIQIRKFPTVIKTVFSKKSRGNGKNQSGGATPFQAMSCALAATIGTGSITGVATALYIGGAGSIFWMWVCSVFGMATAYAEGVLSVKYRVIENGVKKGGAMYYIKYGLNSPKLAALFAAFCILGSLGMGNMAQGNAACEALISFGIPKAVIIIILPLSIALLLLGGKNKVSSFCERLIPFAALFYIGGCILILIKLQSRLPSALSDIITSAFQTKAVAGGVTGGVITRAVAVGFRRGIFSSEAGLGTTASVHGTSDIKTPSEAGYWGMFEVFVDTPIICTLTALVLLTTGQTGSTGSVISAFSLGLGKFGGHFVGISIVLFAFATIVGWSFIGQSATEFLGGKRLTAAYKFFYVILCAVGCSLSIGFVWTLSDTFNGLMALPNLTALILLSPAVFKEAGKSCADKKEKKSSKYPRKSS